MFAGIPIVQLVAGSRVSTSTDEGFALALSDSGDVYSWGKGYKGRLGHSSTENVRSPKMVDALGGKDIKMVTCGCVTAVYTIRTCLLFVSISPCKLLHVCTHTSRHASYIIIKHCLDSNISETYNINFYRAFKNAQCHFLSALPLYW